MISLPRKLSTLINIKVNYSNWHLDFRHQISRRQCLLCETSHHHSTGICPPCISDLPWLSETCSRCGIQLPPEAGTRICAGCQKRPFLFDRCEGLFHYEFPIREIITEFKFRRKSWYARSLGNLLASRILDHYGQELPDLLLATPLHKKRLRERGFNQALELGRIVSRRTGIPLDARTLEKLRSTPHQSGLSARERARNLRRSFKAKRSFDGMHLLLVDDVVTTGHTVNEISRVLKQAGAAQVDIFCVARTPPPR